MIHRRPREDDWNKWEVYQEIVGPKYLYPRYICEAFFSKYQYRDRMHLVNFSIGNGASLDLLLDTIEFIDRGVFCTRIKRDKIIALYYWLSEDSLVGIERRNRYTYYDLIIKRVLNLNGDRPLYYDLQSRVASVTRDSGSGRSSGPGGLC